MLQSFDTVNRAANALWDRVDMSPVVLTCKGIAVTLMLITWWNAYQKSVKDDGPGFDVWTLIYGVLYIGVVVQCDQIIKVFNDIMVSFGNMYVDMLPMPENDLDMFQNSTMIEYNTNGELSADEGLWDTICNFFTYLFSLDWIYDMIAKLGLIVTIVIDYVYFIAREFLLFWVKLLLPLVLAMAVLEKFRDLAWRWIKLIIAVYLLAYVYILAIGFANAFYAEIIQNFTLAGNLGVSEGATGVADVGIKVLVFLTCLCAKWRMFKDGASICYKIFS